MWCRVPWKLWLRWESNKSAIEELHVSSLLNQTFGDPNKELILTHNCIRKLQEISDNDTFLRISVEGGGCSGFQYIFELVKCVDHNDRIFQKNGVKIVVDLTSLEFLKGSTVDYHEEMIKSSFRIFKNPQSQQACSCGSSFSIKFPFN